MAADALGISVRRFNQLWNDVSNIEFDRNRQVPDDVFNLIKSKTRAADKPKSKKKPARSRRNDEPPAPKPTPSEKTQLTYRQVSDALVVVLLFTAVVAHAGLVWWELHDQYQTPGIWGGGISFALILAGVLLALDGETSGSAGWAIFFLAAVDVLAWWLHVGTWTSGITDPNRIVFTKFICAVLCLASFLSLIMLRAFKTERYVNS